MFLRQYMFGKWRKPEVVPMPKKKLLSGQDEEKFSLLILSK